MRTRIKIATAPTIEPVTLTEVKQHLRRTDRREDDYITTLITAAREYCETITRRAFITQTIDLVLDAFPSSDGLSYADETSIDRGSQITIPKPPLQSITSIKYLDSSGTLQTLTSSAYNADTYSEPGRIYLSQSYQWPSTQGIENAVTIKYVAGYGLTAVTVPTALRHAIKLVVAHWFLNRESVLVGVTSHELERTLKSLLWQYRDYRMCY